MNEADKRALIEKILKAGQDIKSARIALAVFNNQASPEDARFFLRYLDSEDPAQRKMAQAIIAHFALPEALPLLMSEVNKIVGGLTFLPDAAYKEELFYKTIVEIFETIFAICRKNNLQNEDLLHLALEIFKKTTNQDLRFTLIKIIAFGQDYFDYFFNLYEKFSEKERRALYYSYAIIDHPARQQLFIRGLKDEKNYEFVVANLLNFKSGKELLADHLLKTNSENRLKALKQMEEADISGLEEVLIELLADENRYVADLSAELIKKNRALKFDPERFKQLVAGSALTNLVRNGLEILECYQFADFHEILFSALQNQPVARNKALILEKLIKRIKGKRTIDLAFSQQLCQTLLVYLEGFHPDREELIVAAARALLMIKYQNSQQLKTVKKTLLELEKELAAKNETKLKNNIVEALGKLNGLIAHYEESELQVKALKHIFELPQERIGAERLQKLKEELEQLNFLDEQAENQLHNFLIAAYESAENDWKKRAIAVELLQNYSSPQDLPFMQNIALSDQSLAVRVAAEKTVAVIREKYNLLPQIIGIFENSFYLKKLLLEYLANKDFRIVEIGEQAQLDSLLEGPLNILFIDENLLNKEIINFFQSHPEKNMVIICSEIAKIADLLACKNIQALSKPIKKDEIEEILSHGKQ